MFVYFDQVKSRQLDDAKRHACVVAERKLVVDDAHVDRRRRQRRRRKLISIEAEHGFDVRATQDGNERLVDSPFCRTQIEQSLVGRQ